MIKPNITGIATTVLSIGHREKCEELDEDKERKDLHRDEGGLLGLSKSPGSFGQNWRSAEEFT